MISIKGKYELSDYENALKLHANQGILSSCLLYYVLAIMVIAEVAAVILALIGIIDWLVLLFPTVFLGSLVFFQFFWRPRRIARIFNQQKELSLPFTIEADEESLHFSNELSSSRLPWNYFVKWKMNDKILLLYRTDIMFNMIPMRLFNNKTDLELILGKLERNQIKKARRNWWIPIIIYIVLFVVIVSIVVLSSVRSQ